MADVKNCGTCGGPIDDVTVHCGDPNIDERIKLIQDDVAYLRTVVEALVGGMKTAQTQPGMAGVMARMMPVPTLPNVG